MGIPTTPLHWTSEADMASKRANIGQPLNCGYAQYIQRLIVTNLYTLA